MLVFAVFLKKDAAFYTAIVDVIMLSVFKGLNDLQMICNLQTRQVFKTCQV